MRILTKFSTVPVAVAALTAITALQYLLIAIGNTFDYGTNFAFVDHVFSMDTTFKDPDLFWRRIDDNVVVTIAYVAVIIWEWLIAIFGIWALVLWIRARTPQRHEQARRMSSLGWIMVLILFGGGFIAIGGEWFAMWQSRTWNGLQPALQNFLLASVGLILVTLPVTSAEGAGQGDEGSR